MFSEDPIDNIQEFQTVKNNHLRCIVDLYVIPVIAALVILIEVLSLQGENHVDWMEVTAWLAIAAAGTLFREVSHRVPETLKILWSRELLILPSPRDTSVDKHFSDMTCRDHLGAIINRFQKRIFPRRSDMPLDLKKRYCLYITDFENWLNNRAWNLVCGFLVSLVVVIRYLYQFYPNWNYNPLLIFYYGIMYVVAFILGMFLWRMLVIANQIRILGKNFDFSLQIKHPDGCGGLNILGDLNLINTAIITIPGVYFAVWIILLMQAKSTLSSLTATVYSNLTANAGNVYSPEIILKTAYEAKDKVPFSEYFYTYWYINDIQALWLDYFIWLLLFVVILTFFIFFIPLYCVHREMELQSGPIQVSLDKIFKKISDLSQKLLYATGLEESAVESENIKSIKSDISLLQDVYDRNSPIPVWPFNRTIAIKFLVSQSIALLTLAGGLIQEFLIAFKPLTDIIITI